MFDKLIKYILGYLNIQIEGYYLEKFLNLCKKNKIRIWNISKKSEIDLNCNILKKDFKKLKEINRLTKNKIHINKKNGLLYFYKKYRKRKIFIILLFFCIILISFLSRFVWNIEFINSNENDNSNINTLEFMQYLKDKGIYIGAIKRKINTKDIISKIRLDYEEISWISIDIKGTNVMIKFTKSTKKPEIINEEEACNILSNKIGIITKINVRNGTALKKVGDVVKKDDVLVGGWIEGKYTDIRYVHSDADIEAKVWYSKRKIINFTKIKKCYKGAKTTEMGIFLGKKQINFFKSLHKFENYDKIEEKKKIKLFSNFYLPIEIKKIKYLEFEEIQEKLEFNDAKENTIEELKNELNNEINQNSNIINIENEKVNIYENDGLNEIEVVYEVIEKIGEKQKFEY